MVPPHTYTAGHTQSGQPADQQQNSDTQTDILIGKRAVIVEDEGMTQMQLKMMLTRAGVKVVGQALTGEQGITQILRERPEIVLLDIKMPGAIDGLEVARRVLAEYATCIVIMTAYGNFQEQARTIGAAEYIVKPVDSRVLIPKIRDALQQYERSHT